MPNRIIDIAQELGINAQAILDKCRAEGISASVLKGVQSQVSSVLERTIREWFDDQDGGAQAPSPLTPPPSPSPPRSSSADQSY